MNSREGAPYQPPWVVTSNVGPATPQSPNSRTVADTSSASYAAAVSIVKRSKPLVSNAVASPTADWFTADDRGALRMMQQMFLRKLRGSTGPYFLGSGGGASPSSVAGFAVRSALPSEPSARPMPPPTSTVAAFRPSALPKVQVWRGPCDEPTHSVSPIRRHSSPMGSSPTGMGPVVHTGAPRELVTAHLPTVLGGQVAGNGTSRHAKRRRLLRERRYGEAPSEMADISSMSLGHIPLLESVYRANAPLHFHFDPDALTDPHDIFGPPHRRTQIASGNPPSHDNSEEIAAPTNTRGGHPPALTNAAAARRLWQRRRQLELGFRTMGYHVYRVMKERGEVLPVDAAPPPPEQLCSKRSWDGQMRRWRHVLHEYDTFAVTMSESELALVRERMAQDYARRVAARAASKCGGEDDDDNDDSATDDDDVASLLSDTDHSGEE